MTTSRWFTGAAMLLLVTAAHAHAHLTKSDPAEGSTLKVSPEQISLTFSEAARLTTLTIKKDGGKEFKLEQIPATPSPQISIPAPKLEPGQYTLNWRVVSDDKHVMAGTVHFTIEGSAAASAPSPAATK